MKELPLFKDLRDAWADGLGNEFRRSAISFLILCLLALGGCLALPDLRTRLVELVFSTINGMELINEAGAISALALFINNLQACAVIMLYGLIPFIMLPALSLGVNAMMLGVLAALYLSEGLSLAAYLALLIPHGIFELPAMALAFAMGLYICGQVTRRCKRDKTARSVLNCLTLASQLLVLVMLPLLAAAAVIEAYVTPWMASFFL